MAFPRLPRFTRSAPIAPIELTERDHHIIRLVHRHRFLRSNHIVSLIGGSPQQILRRLQLLYHHGYLERPRVQIDYYHRGGSRPIVYGLGSKGAIFLNVATPGIRWGAKNRAVGRVYLEHAVLVSEVMVALELACRASGRIRLLSEPELFPGDPANQSRFPFRVTLEGGIRLGIIPDQVFALEFPRENGSRERQYFFLEADRGTMPVVRNNLTQTSFRRKLLAYQGTWTQGVHQSKFGFHRFRVLTITTSRERLDTLIEACSRLERGRGLFLFADISVLEKPERLFEKVFQTGKGEPGGLLD